MPAPAPVIAGFADGTSPPPPNWPITASGEHAYPRVSAAKAVKSGLDIPNIEAARHFRFIHSLLTDYRPRKSITRRPVMGSYYVNNQDWPSGASDLDMPAAEVFAVLDDDFDLYWAAAQQSLREGSDG
jgi:hypothetical protein